ncbi:putative trehalase [Canna indica]|uniref:Trehalase n=1 Tax=Canna indica TaxID=4628 RepID=A0AAQ3KID3_9LILI|nr:putative trehalase [Canna indica]
MVERGIRDIMVAKVWKCKGPLKMKIILWLVVKRRLQTKDRLIKHGCVDLDPKCIFCKILNETSSHLFGECLIISTGWSEFLGKVGKPAFNPISVCGFSRRNHRVKNLRTNFASAKATSISRSSIVESGDRRQSVNTQTFETNKGATTTNPHRCILRIRPLPKESRSGHMASSNAIPNSSASSYPILLLLFSVAWMSSSADAVRLTPTAPLVAFLERVQAAALSTLGPSSDFDPKLYVDLPLKSNLADTEAAFDALPRIAGVVPAADFDRFVNEYFGEAGSDMVYAAPVDFVPEPPGFLPKVEHSEVRAWALEVHALWKNLTRKVADEVRERPELHTLLPLPKPVVVPGSRFREVYYWDSYWSIRGLLASKMYETAKGIVRNLLSLVDIYGFVLNGARVYYTNRSQPPLLSGMVLEIYEKTGDLEFVKECLPLLLKEHKFWNSEIHKVDIQDSQGHMHSVYHYNAMWNKPRPESGTIDKESASKLPNAAQKRDFYHEVASTAESGWDFSSRWMRNSSDLTTLATTTIIPVDLNAFIYMMESSIAYFAKISGDSSTSETFLAASKSHLAAIQSIFWNSDMGQWLDYWLISKSKLEKFYKWEADHQNRNIFASNFIPLWIGAYGSDGQMAKKVLESFKKSGLLYPAGIATSLTNTGQQWDFPNGWAPLQHMIAEGLANSGIEEAKSLAEDIAVRWIRTNYDAYKKTGAMHEKYDVEACGGTGGGGEYIPQTGFGWSNGVVLAFLEDFGWPRDREIGCPS